MSNLKQQLTKCVNADMQNLTKNVLDQKWSNLCVPISVTTLLRFAMKNDLNFYDKSKEYTFEQILTTLTMIVYPRSLAGLNLNPKEEEKDFQTNEIKRILERICAKTYLKESGWQIVRKRGFVYPVFSECEFKNGISLSKISSKNYFSYSKWKLRLFSSTNRHWRLSPPRRYSLLPPDGARPRRRLYRRVRHSKFWFSTWRPCFTNSQNKRILGVRSFHGQEQ